MSKTRRTIENTRTRKEAAKRGLPLALLALITALSSGVALASEPPIVFGDQPSFPSGPQCGRGNDTDGDGVCNAVDNCPRVFNPVQSDLDLDGHGDACDNCPAVPNGLQGDRDRNGVGDACEQNPSTPTTPTGPSSGSSGPVDFGRK